MEPEALAGCAVDELAEAIVQVHAAEMAVRATLCELIAAFDAQEAWREDGATSMAAWLAMRLGMGWSAAAELAQVATSLQALPKVAEVAAGGALSWDQLAAVSGLASATTDGEWAERVPGMTPAELQSMARRTRDEAQPVRAVRYRLDRHRDWGRVWGRLPAAEVEIVAGALQRLAEGVPPNPETGVLDPYESRCADALVGLAGASGGGERSTLVVHVGATDLASDGEGITADGSPVAGDVVSRMACDGRIESVVEGDDGLVGIGRAGRTPPAWLSRRVRKRDGGCRFPGCGRTRWTDSHHIVHWSKGGPTADDNLITLCGYHHRFVHRRGWRIEGSPHHEVVFRRPDGRAVEVTRPGLLPEIADRLGIGGFDSS